MTHAQDYGVTLVYYLSHYLVDLVRDRAGRTVLKLDTVYEGLKWLDADVLVFGSWRWWARKRSELSSSIALRNQCNAVK